jgi:hypothetical protein
VRGASAAKFVATAAVAIAASGCGLAVRAPDLFLLKRVGQGRPLTLLVNDGGTIRCNGGPAKQLPDPLLLRARTLANDLDKDAKAGLRIPSPARSVASYTIKLQDGTISFPDTAAATHPELGRAELFALQVSQNPCGLGR